VLFSYSSDGSPSHLVLHPTLVPTPFLDIATSLPLPPGTPITLLPYGTPAYFLATYNGPTAGLKIQFQSSLQGIGAGLWDSSSTKSPTFIIAWIKVENKQGEDKGITIIYPTALCLSYIPLSTSRPPLDYIPELSAPLQPSPQVAPAVLSISQNLESPRTTPYPPRPSLFSSPTSDSLQLFRGLTLSKSNDLRQVATEVGSYVDAVARERERERERLKRERESGSSASPKLARTSVTTPASVPTPISTDNSIITQSHLPPPPPPPQLQPAISLQNFYPSPPTVPNTVPASEGNTSPVVESSDTQPITSTVTPSAPDSTSQEPAATNNGSYDLFNMDSYNMGMDLDLDDIGIDFDMNMGSMLATASSTGGTYAPAQNGSMGMEYEDAFTDEDFSFFDAPARSAPTPVSGPHFPPTSRLPSGPGKNTQHTHTRSTSSGGSMSSSHLVDTLSAPTSQQTIWTPGAFGIDGFTPRSIDHHDSSAADHLLSPGQTPFTHTARHDDDDAMHARASSASFVPAPPNVHLEYDPGAIQRSASHSTSSSHTAVGPTSRFEPIPFSKYHRDADGKYAVGKFAFSLPSPPPEDDEQEAPEGEALGSDPPSSWVGTDSQRRSRPKRWRWRPQILRTRSTPVLNATVPAHHVPWSPTGSGGGSAATIDLDDGSVGWRSRYNAATNPRIGVLRKLIGAKRKNPTLPHALAARKRTKSTSWVTTPEEDWSTPWLQDGVDAQSPVVAESEDEEEEEDEDEDIESPMLSRPTTPPPAYLPLGPTLLHTQFQHAHLLPLSTPLRPPGAAVAPINLSHPAAHPPPSVPTPVSPAATMGAANEKSKSLETAAFAIAAEVVENPVWGETWRASAVGAKPTPELWSADYKAVADLLGGVQGLESRVSMEDFFELGKSLSFLRITVVY